MAMFSQALFIAVSGLVLATALPQYGQSDSGSAPAAAPASSSPVSSSSFISSSPGSSSSFISSTSGSPSSSFSSSSFGSSSGSSGGASGPLSVQCRASPDSSGKLRYDCSGVNKDAITLKTEHFLWLENQGANSQNLDIEVPNYNIDEFIRAAYKALGPQDGAKINILLKKPDVTYNAEKDAAPQQQVGQPAVSVNYQPVDKISVHYPTQKNYINGGSSSSSSAGSSGFNGGSSSGSSSGFNSGSSSGSSSGFNSGSSFGSGSVGGGNGGSSSTGSVGGGNGGTSSTSSGIGGGNGGSSSGSVGSGNGGSSSGGRPGGYSRPQRESNFRYYFVRQ